MFSDILISRHIGDVFAFTAGIFLGSMSSCMQGYMFAHSQHMIHVMKNHFKFQWNVVHQSFDFIQNKTKKRIEIDEQRTNTTNQQLVE